MRTLAILALLGLVACADKSQSPPPKAPTTTSLAICRADTAGQTVGAAAKTGAVAAADGLVQVGSATTGLVEDGASGAKANWNARKAETKKDASANAAETDRAANGEKCE